MPPPSTPRKIFKDFAKKEIMLSAAPPIPPRPWNSASFPNITMIMWDYAITILCFWDLSKRIISWVLTVWFISIFLLYIAMKYSSISSLPPLSPTPRLSAGGQLSVPNFEKGGSEKKWVAGWTQWVPAMGIYLGAYYVSCQKRLLKIQYAFEGSISNVDLGLL